MDLMLSGRRALVCAATKGLGRAIAAELVREGVEVLVVGRDQERLEELTQALSGVGNGKIRAFRADLSQSEDRFRLLGYIAEHFAAVDILVNNIGGPPMSSALETSAGAWQEGFDRLFHSVNELSVALVQGMMQRGFGRIITVSSLSALEPIPNLVVSTAIRAAVTAFNKQLSSEVALRGVTVNTVMPGIFATDRVLANRRSAAERHGTTLEIEMAKTIQQIPLGRMGLPEEFAAMVAFLASPRASYMTGLNIAVDGGMRHSWH